MKKLKRIALVFLAVLMLSACSCGAPKGGADVPAGMKKVEMDIDDYNLYIPQEWTEDISTGVATAYLTDNSSISLMTVQLDNDTPDLDSYWKKTEEDFKTTFGESFKYDGEHPQQTLLGGAEARKYVYTAKVTGTEYKFMQVICMRTTTAMLSEYNYAYIFTYTAAPEVYDSHLDDIEEILTNFSFNN